MHTCIQLNSNIRILLCIYSNLTCFFKHSPFSDIVAHIYAHVQNKCMHSCVYSQVVVPFKFVAHMDAYIQNSCIHVCNHSKHMHLSSILHAYLYATIGNSSIRACVYWSRFSIELHYINICMYVCYYRQ